MVQEGKWLFFLGVCGGKLFFVSKNTQKDLTEKTILVYDKEKTKG